MEHSRLVLHDHPMPRDRGTLAGVVIYGPNCRPPFLENEVCRNRESGVFLFPGTSSRVAPKQRFDNHRFDLAVRDADTRPHPARHLCRENMLSGIVRFHHAETLVLDNICRGNQRLGVSDDAAVLVDPRRVTTYSLPMCWNPTRAAHTS